MGENESVPIVRQSAGGSETPLPNWSSMYGIHGRSSVSAYCGPHMPAARRCKGTRHTMTEDLMTPSSGATLTGAPSTSTAEPERAHLRGRMVYKWGMDGATGQSIYKLKSSDESGKAEKKYVEESSIFCSTLVPLQLVIEERNVWQNAKPSSTALCRPIHLQAAKETV